MNSRKTANQSSQGADQVQEKCKKTTCKCNGNCKKKPGPIKHGAHSPTVRKRFDDLRTNQGQALHGIMTSLVDHFGGETALTAPMRILIDINIRPKLITILLINDHINKKQDKILNDEGELIKCLSANYLAFSNALRLDLVALNDMAAKAGKSSKGVPSLDTWIEDQSK